MPTIRTKRQKVYRTKSGRKVKWDAIPTERWYESDITMAVFGVFGWVGTPAIMSLIYMALN